MVYDSPNVALMAQLLGVVFLRHIQRRNTQMSLVILKKPFTFLIGVILWKLESLRFRQMVLGNWYLLSLVLI
jgi:hypothetical protein